jgi:hypothetical protein
MSLAPFCRTIFCVEPDVDGDVCYRCGYVLRGIDDDRPCPECGLLARRSRRTTDELRYTRPRWLRRVSRGTNLLLAAIVMIAVSPALSLALLRLSNEVVTTRGPVRLLPLLALLGVDLAALLIAAGAWLLASPEGYPPADRADRRLRWSLRAAALAPAVMVVAQNVERYLRYNGGFWGVYDRGWNALNASMAASALGIVPLPLLLFLVLRGLAKRARSAHVAEHCTIVGIGASAAVSCGLAMGLLVRHGEAWGLPHRWVQRSPAALFTAFGLSIAALLFAIWSVYVLARFAIAFRRTSRQLRGAWRADDRALSGVRAAAT